MACAQSIKIIDFSEHFIISIIDFIGGTTVIHTFESCGKKMALDVGSGAVHALDDLSYDALRLYSEGTALDEVGAALEGQYPAAEIAEVVEEIRSLIELGQLDTDDQYGELEVSKNTGVVKAMCLLAAQDCNLRCRYCFASTGEYHMGARSLLSFETGKAALDWLIAKSGKRRNLEVDFFGGEPLMNWDVVRRLVEYGRSVEKEHDKLFKFTVTTNCVGLTEEIMAFINKEMDNVVLSIDGRPEVHDRMRPTANGKGSFELIMPKAKRLAETRGQQRYYVRGTFSAHNLDFGEDVLYLADQGFEQVSVEPVVADASLDYAITDDMVPAINEEYERLARIYIRRRRDGKWFNFFHFMVDLSGGPCLRKRLTGCGAGNEYVAVTTQGDIYPCHQFVGREGYRMGSVLDGSFNTAIQDEFAGNHVLAKEKCRDCWAKFYCSGGCAANAQAFNGDIHIPHDMECDMERKRLECAMAIWAIENENEPNEE